MSTELVELVSDLAFATPPIIPTMQKSLDRHLSSKKTSSRAPISSHHTYTKVPRLAHFKKREEKQKSGIEVAEAEFQKTLGTAYESLSQEEFKAVVFKSVESSYKIYYTDLKHHFDTTIKTLQIILYTTPFVLLVGLTTLLIGYNLLFSGKNFTGIAFTAFGIFCCIGSIFILRNIRKSNNKIEETKRDLNTLIRFRAAMHYVSQITDPLRKADATETLLREISSEMKRGKILASRSELAYSTS